VLLFTITASFLALFWSLVLLMITMLMAGLILCQLVSPYIEDFDPSRIEDAEFQRWMFERYGTAGRSLWTVFEITFAGSWPSLVRPLVEKVSVSFGFFFGAYVFLVVFAMTRIITALFIKDTLAVATNDAEMMIQAKMKEKRANARKLLDVFSVADTSGEGRLTLEEFEIFMEEPRARSYLGSLELEAHESRQLFMMLDDGDGMITAEEFVEGALRLKGVARSQDVICMMHDFNTMAKVLAGMQEQLAEVYEASTGKTQRRSVVLPRLSNSMSRFSQMIRQRPRSGSLASSMPNLYSCDPSILAAAATSAAR